MASRRKSDALKRNNKSVGILGQAAHTIERFLFVWILVAPLPFCLSLFSFICFGSESRAWDGSGHYAIAKVFSESIFPNTFGWTDNYFTGMPIPNFYPPLFYWLIVLFKATHLVTLSGAFKLVLISTSLLVPLSVYFLAQSISNRDKLVSIVAAMASIILCVDTRFMGALLAGIDYFSTFQIGLYAQPLGFLLLVCWFLVYSKEDLSPWVLSLSAILLALTILTSFFNAITAGILIFSSLAVDLTPNVGKTQKAHVLKIVIAKLLSPVVALLLSFWLVPMIAEYDYFVTRPYTTDLKFMFTPALVIWYVVAVAGGLFWLRHATSLVKVYLLSCALIAALVIISSTFAPRWLPIQTPRFLATLTFMLAVPVGYSLARALRLIAAALGELNPKRKARLIPAPVTTAIGIIGFLLISLTAPDLGRAYSFYPPGKRDIDGVLSFARQHRDGRYLVEVINQQIGSAWSEAAFDARALNSYLGSQHSEVISGVFHEASPNSIFTLPVVNAFSNFADSFGVSSVLADDLDFYAQPLKEHLKRAEFLGVKYLVIRTPAMKERLSKEVPGLVRYDVGWWSVFQLNGQYSNSARVLLYKPALVISDFSVKARRRNEMNYTRLAEEQFADAWFDVLLVRSQRQIDHISQLENFGALIVEKYDWSDENKAYETLLAFAKTKPLILFRDESEIFRRLQANSSQLPLLQIIDRVQEGSGETVDSLRPTFHYNPSAIRRQWGDIRKILEDHKIRTTAQVGNVNTRRENNSLTIDYNNSDGAEVPILIPTTPNWARVDGQQTYASTPFFMLTFTSKPTTLLYQRTAMESRAVYISGIVAVCLFAVMAWPGVKKVMRIAKHK